MSSDPSSPKPAFDVRRFECVENVSHDGKRYFPGQVLPPLTERQAARLLAGGVIEVVAGSDPVRAPGGKAAPAEKPQGAAEAATGAGKKGPKAEKPKGGKAAR